MKLSLILFLTIFSVLLLATGIAAQKTNTAAEDAARLRAQLIDLQDKEAQSKIHLEELDFALKPENIERQTSGYGSVHPEELRELRRKQLQAEKDRVLAQLDLLATSRTRLEAAIAEADAKA